MNMTDSKSSYFRSSLGLQVKESGAFDEVSGVTSRV